MAKILKADTKANSEKAIILSKDSPSNIFTNTGRPRNEQIIEELSSYKDLPLESWHIEVINRIGLVQEGFLIHACPYSSDEANIHGDIDWLSLKYNELTLLSLSSYSKHDLVILREYGKAIGKLLLEPKLSNIFWHLLIEGLIGIINPYGFYSPRILIEKLQEVGFTRDDIMSRQELPSWKKKQFLLASIETGEVKGRYRDIFKLNSEKQILPVHLLSSFTREEKRLYHLIMDNKRIKASAQTIDASKISKEPPREYIQTTNGVIRIPNDFKFYGTLTERQFKDHLNLIFNSNGESNEQ